MTTIVAKVSDSVAIEINDLPKDFSFAYTFFRNVGQELRLLKKEIENAKNSGNEATAKYLLMAQKYLMRPKISNIEYVGGCSISPVLDAIQTLAYSGELIFSNSVAYSVKDRMEDEIAAISQEYEYCKLAYHISDSSELFDQLIQIIRNSESESEAIDKLQSEMTLIADEAEFIQNLSIGTLSDRDLISGKVKSMYFLLTYLTYLKTIMKS